MITPDEILRKLRNLIGKQGFIAFFSAFVSGLLTHFFALTSDIPNHDGLASLYFDQNMITSGRWFLGTACSPSSFYTLPWIIGILSLVYIGIAAIFLKDILNLKSNFFIAMAGIVIAVFPSLASNFAYVFTMDGYMLGMMLCVAAVWAVEKSRKYGWIPGAVCLAFGMGCYQSYICITMLLCLVKCAQLLWDEGNARDKTVNVLRYFAMGGAGVILYYVLLKVLLWIQGKELDTYQGINGMSSGNGAGLIGTLKYMYSDFFEFTFKSRVFVNGIACTVAMIVLSIASLVVFGCYVYREKLYRKPLFYVLGLVVIVLGPCVMNGILLISTEVTYHVLMRYQWAFLITVMIAIVDKKPVNGAFLQWTSFVAGLALIVLTGSYAVTDNIAYFNLNEKYEKTYAYCLRMADRIEQTPGYYPGIPIAMVGVVGQDSYPSTDITGDVTGSLLGISGDFLLYKSENYEAFFKNYLGISFNMVSSDEVVNFYNEDFYAEMESFPLEGSVLLHDGVIYVKTENKR